ncbi:MAG: DUF481 domain-containing protein [Paludibacteraceae bacterium]|nr:DUF481 domain-containing protein [Paludibacteraceae bacterium]
MRNFVFYVVFVSCLLLPGWIVSQNVPRKMKYSASAGASFYSGNVDKLDLKSTAGILRQDSVVAFDLNGKFVYSRSDGEENNRGLETVGKLDFFQYNTWSPFVAVECKANRYKGYDYILSALAGGKCRIYHNEGVSDYSVSLAFMFDRAKYTPVSTGLSSRNYRLSFRPKAVQKLGTVLTLKDIFYYQPSVRDLNDYVLMNLLIAECRISTYLFMCVGYEYEYRSETPSDDFKHHDTSLDVSLKFVY